MRIIYAAQQPVSTLHVMHADRSGEWGEEALTVTILGTGKEDSPSRAQYVNARKMRAGQACILDLRSDGSEGAAALKMSLQGATFAAAGTDLPLQMCCLGR